MLHVFDLDMTVIDSSHRRHFLPDGSLDLDHWRKSCTAEHINRDTLLPLARTMRKAFDLSTVCICTARVMGWNDWLYLRKHNLLFHYAETRQPGDERNNVTFKRDRLYKLADTVSKPFSEIVLYEDEPKTIDMARSLGCRVIDATFANHIMLQRLGHFSGGFL